MKISSLLGAATLASASAIVPRQNPACTGNETELGDFSLSEPSLLKVPPIVDAEARLVTFPVEPGTDLSNLSPTFCTASGVSSSPSSGTSENLSAPVTYYLSSTSSGSVQWTFQAVDMGSPVLAGLYADPNIAFLNGQFYIFSTTDGFPSWGGKVLYVWKSSDLLHWTRSSDPILTLDGANGNVPWATGNAWAPTIVERNSTFYLYFSGNNPQYDRKTIGVATAASPDGPWTAQPTPMILNNERLTVNQAIDPAAFVDPETGRYLLFWGNGPHPLVAELSDDMLSVNWDTAQNVTGLTNFTEASFVNYRNGLYHYTFSVGDTNDADYYVGYATAKSAYGPWQYQGKLLQQRPELGIYATGSSSIIQAPGTDDWYICYHRFAIPNGNGTDREVTIDSLQIGQDGIFQTVVPTLSSIEPVQLSNW